VRFVGIEDHVGIWLRVGVVVAMSSAYDEVRKRPVSGASEVSGAMFDLNSLLDVQITVVLMIQTVIVPLGVGHGADSDLYAAQVQVLGAGKHCFTGRI